ncbi:HD domain-containing protein [Actinomycetospora termitidis]|uniref:HD domain-containing protein n=1 Tax=Actinomycetospora termitidis TaxID=3053470 RepID=A0ABT7M784_9PSEU|nr:HD domain-containing protein [Actinomycetospora sp. Odt1-22]MDL5156311.1 HD domain-containing protein [Actinomycetospora sp. Odt1-22]
MSLAQLVGPFREIGDLKRVHVAGRAGSIADHAFVRAWSALAGGADPTTVADAECAAAVAGARLAGLDATVLHDAGLTRDEARAVRTRAIDEVGAALTDDTRRRLVEAPDPVEDLAHVPPFAHTLVDQPRAGATAPGRPRMIVEPPEDHGEHCWAVAVYGALVAEDLGADPGEAFLLGLAHHLHNVAVPDAGFAGEILLGDHLGSMLERLTERELATLPTALADRVRGLLTARADADTPLGRAFHAADVLDRVLQVHHHARAAAFTAKDALVDLELVHESPVSAYHDAVLTEAGLLP